jgi:hypothetical protein
MAYLGDQSVLRLITFLKSQPRATKQANRGYIDTGNNRSLICLPRHSVVFGRRGSGKTMLLSELLAAAPANNHGVIWVDIDDYKTLTFPDILVQVLRSLFLSLYNDVRKCNPWYRPIRRLASRSVLGRLRAEEHWLSELLQRFEEADLRVDEQRGLKDSSHQQSGLEGKGPISAKLSEKRSSEQSMTRTESSTGRDRKVDRISRHLHDAKALLRDATALAFKQYYLVLDDFYHLTIADQSQVLDYLQSLTKNLNLFIKFGTIAHRSSLYRRGQDLIHGMQKEHDVLPIDLDRTFQNFTEVEQFIRDLWRQIQQNLSAEFDDLFAGHSWQQLILASGGVPRDFMNILARALEIGRSRHKDRLDVFLVNEAANLYLRETKHEDLISDRAEETGEIEQMLLDIRDFCVNQRKRNLFLVSKDELEQKQHEREMLRQLLDYRLVHLVHGNTSAAGVAGRYEAYMLDVGLYAHPQRRGKNQVTQVDFLSRDDQHRADAIRTQPIYDVKENYTAGAASPFDAPADADTLGAGTGDVEEPPTSGGDRELPFGD